MNGFVIAAGMMTVIHLVAGWQRPRRAVIISRPSWGCSTPSGSVRWRPASCAGDADCNIGVDLVFLLPILALATLSAYQAYNRT